MLSILATRALRNAKRAVGGGRWTGPENSIIFCGLFFRSFPGGVCVCVCVCVCACVRNDSVIFEALRRTPIRHATGAACKNTPRKILCFSPLCLQTAFF